MDLLCAAGFWVVVLMDGGKHYTDDPRTAPGEVRAVVCRAWDSLPGLVHYTPFPAVPVPAPPAARPLVVVPILGQSRQGYPTCAAAREAMRWSDVPCAPWTPER